MESDIEPCMEIGLAAGRITESVDVLVETHIKYSENRDAGIGSFLRLAKEGDENRFPWLILVGRLDTLTRNASATALETAKWLASRLEKTDREVPDPESEANRVTIEITEKQAGILRELRKTCLEHVKGTFETYIWEVYARTLGEILNSKERECEQ